MSYVGSFLVATPLITDPHFFHTVVYLYAHDPEQGAAGVVLNRPSDEPALDYLPGWRSCLAAPPVVFWGGPVAESNGLILTVTDGRIGLADGLEPPPGTARARLFVGQAGWGPGQLEAEIDEGAWLVTDADASRALTPLADTLWADILRQEGGLAAMWSTHVLDPTMN